MRQKKNAEKFFLRKFFLKKIFLFFCCHPEIAALLVLWNTTTLKGCNFVGSYRDFFVQTTEKVNKWEKEREGEYFSD